MVQGASNTTRHLIHEGLSRVDVDAVLGSVGAAGGPDVVFSVWHPELVQVRCVAGRYRHPAQVVVTASGSIPFDHCIMFDEPELRVIVITRGSVAPSLRDRLHDRPGSTLSTPANPVAVQRVAPIAREGHSHHFCGRGAAHGGLPSARRARHRPLCHAALGGAPLVDGRLYEAPPLLCRRLLTRAGCDEADGICLEHLVRPGIYSPPPAA